MRTESQAKLRYFFKNITNIDGSRRWFEREYETASEAFKYAEIYEGKGCVVEVQWRLSKTASEDI